MAFTDLVNLHTDYSQGKGIVKLWSTPNVITGAWRANGSADNGDIYSYFFIPSRFVYIGGNSFHFITPFKYVNKQRTVTGWVEHRGRHDLIDGLTEPFWHLEPSNNIVVEPQTDASTKLPYLLTQSIGEPNFTQEKCYFIPCNTEY